MSKPWWKVGKAREPLPEDKYYDDEQSAIDKAALMYEANSWNEPIAVIEEISFTYGCAARNLGACK